MDRGRRQVWLMVQMMMLRLTLMLARSMLANRRRRTVMGPQPPPTPPPLKPRRGAVIQRRRLNPLGLTDQQVLTTYRLDMNTIMDLLRSIEADITPEIRINTAISPLLKLLSVLHFCATGIFQHSTSMLHGLSQPMFCRILKQVMAAILKRADEHIYMPTTSAEMNPMKAAFFAISRFPHVIGCIDGTHIPIVPPSLNEQSYRNRKMTHSLNVQMVCDSNMCITNVCSRFPGSAHDSRILRSSTFYDYMEQHAPPRTVILGKTALFPVFLAIADSIASIHICLCAPESIYTKICLRLWQTFLLWLNTLLYSDRQLLYVVHANNVSCPFTIN